ncbi:MAG: CubicO group peptidase (beta-lactamase class C family) [Paraglaciecola psychrophila]
MVATLHIASTLSAPFNRKLSMYYFKLTISTTVLMVLWIAVTIFGGLYGWWMNPIASAGDTEGFFHKATEIIVEENRGNAAFLIIESGKIVKEYYSNTKDPIDKDTVFATASMSKWLTASAIMKLVQDQKIDLDLPISSYLTRWQLPPSEFDNDDVTTRRLLSHTAGLTDGLGFGDYQADEKIPTLEQSLSAPRASTNRQVEISVKVQPGAKWSYSGGGYLILELLIEEVSGITFQEYMNLEFFNPLNMSRSTYSYMANISNNAGSYDHNGDSAPVYQYASNAATGFSTSSADLAKFVLAQLPELNTAAILDRGILESMRRPYGRTLGFDIWGLGTILYAPTGNNDFVFGHDGGNDPAINSTARINPANGDAIILLETGHLSLATNIGSQWVLWQTGYPDVLDTAAVIASMYLPGWIGLAFLLVVSFYVGYRHYRQLISANNQQK